NQGYCRSVGGLAFGSRLPLLAQVEVVARILRRLHALPRSIAHGAIRQSGRNHDRFLRAANDDIDAPAIHVEVRRAQSRNGIDDKQGIRFLRQSSYTLHTVARTRRDRKSTRLNSSHRTISYAVFCLKK